MSGMVPTDVYRLAGAGDPRLSPDGSRVASVRWWIDGDANEYRSQIRIGPADGSSPARRLSSAPAGRQAEPRWSADGRRLAFTCAAGRDPAQLYVAAARGGEPARLTDLAESVGEIAWSPDGRQIAFSARVQLPALREEDERRRPPRRISRLGYKLDSVGWTSDRRRQLFTVPADGSAPPTQITGGDFEHSEPAWSPDGARIAFTSARDPDWDISTVADIFVVDAGGGEPRRVTAGDATCGSPVWSPDGTEIAHLYWPGVMDSPRHGQVAVVPAGGGERRVLTASLDRNCAPYPSPGRPQWDGDRIVVCVEDRGNVHVYEVAAGGGSPPRPLVDGELAVTGFHTEGGALVHTASHSTAPAELFCGRRQLTRAGRRLTLGRELVAPERFQAESGGGEVDAWMVRPAGFQEGRRYPLLLSIHGGPFSQYGSAFMDEFQVWAGAGYAVAYSNPRGSSGYTEAWGRANRGPVEGGPGWGSVDYEDVMAVVDAALARFPFCDPGRLGVLGGSYGGYMTSWIVGHSERFQAACSERALNSFVSQWGSSDIGWDLSAYTGGFQFEHMQAHLDCSPTTYADRITTPLLILHSEDDLRCNVEQAEQLFTTLRILRRPVEMVRFGAESHELSRSGSPVHRVQRFEVILDWFDRHLQAPEA